MQILYNCHYLRSWWYQPPFYQYVNISTDFTMPTSLVPRFTAHRAFAKLCFWGSSYLNSIRWNMEWLIFIKLNHNKFLKSESKNNTALYYDYKNNVVKIQCIIYASLIFCKLIAIEYTLHKNNTALYVRFMFYDMYFLISIFNNLRYTILWKYIQFATPILVK